MAGTPDTRPDQGGVEYNPTEHQGLLYVLGQHIIVADAKQAALGDLPLDVRKAVAKETAAQLALIDFSRGVGGVIIEIEDETRTSQLEEGYHKGLKLLGFEYDANTNLLKKVE